MMLEYVFVRNINGTDETGIADISKNPPELICYCNEAKSKLLLEALNIHSKKVVIKSDCEHDLRGEVGEDGTEYYRCAKPSCGERIEQNIL